MKIRSRLTEKIISEVFQNFIKKKHLYNSYETAFIFYDLSVIKNRIEEIIRLFPVDTIHAVAVKANPLKKIMKYISVLGGGFEAASLPELQMSINSGAEFGRIVFDSPCKTKGEIKFALEQGIHINADSFIEIERISGILEKINSRSNVGLRINPQTGIGRIESTSVSGKYSKFGVPLDEKNTEIIDAYNNHKWLNGIHLHTGSQGCSLDQLVKGVRKILDLALEINRKLNGQITIFDIGGGLPVQYKKTDPLITMEMYRKTLRKICPEIFSGKLRLITEFGRYIHANSGWAVSRVEYVKEYSSNTLMIHLGADMFIRECYNPDDWHHDIFLTGPDGKLKKSADKKRYNIAGPLCFAGDIIGREIELPEAAEGDYLVIRDTGAYTLSMWSRYNSRQIPMVIGVGPEDEFVLLKDRDPVDKVTGFWE